MLPGRWRVLWLWNGGMWNGKWLQNVTDNLSSFAKLNYKQDNGGS